ncbi:Fibroblast growth factor 1 [Exaiptasia diaphana]|nr:Fibroblast growth factor 1 [Exaiptasia diaphana]
MDRNGSLSGVLHQNEIFEIQSFGPSVVRIKHEQTGMYIAMDSKGKIKGQKNPPLKDTYFYQNHEENAFVSFASYFHRKKNGLQMFLGVKRGGNVKYGRRTRAGQDSMQFLLLYVNYTTKPI